MLRAAVEFAFLKLHLVEVTLGVFDFNTPAIDTFESVGFSEFEFKKGARPFKNETWNVIRMKLSKQSWLQRNNHVACGVE